MIGRVSASPFFEGWARGQFGGRSTDAANAWGKEFSDRVINETLTEEDERLIERCEASIAIARDLGFPDSGLTEQQQAAILQKLLERYPLPTEEEGDDDANF